MNDGTASAISYIPPSLPTSCARQYTMVETLVANYFTNHSSRNNNNEGAEDKSQCCVLDDDSKDKDV